MVYLHTMGSDGIYKSFIELQVCYSPKSCKVLQRVTNGTATNITATTIESSTYRSNLLLLFRSPYF